MEALVTGVSLYELNCPVKVFFPTCNTRGRTRNCHKQLCKRMAEMYDH